MKSIIAIFKDENDAESWAAYLDGISAVWGVTGDAGLGRSVERLMALGIDPAVVIVSSRLYQSESELAATIRECFPAAELLLVSSAEDPSPPLLQLWADAVRHVEVSGPTERKGHLYSVLEKVVNHSPFAIGDQLTSPSSVRTFEMTSSDKKDWIIDAVHAAIDGEDDGVELFRQRAVLLADEMIENALYGAPRNVHGEKLFRKGEVRCLLPEERLVFRFGFDGETLAMEMVDNWGTLDADQVVEFLARNHEQDPYQEEIGGRGLFLIWRFFDHFHVSIYPGARTVVGGNLALSRNLDPEGPRGFHIIVHRKGEAA